MFAGRSHPALAHAICRELNVELGKCHIFDFSNENIFVQIEENVRNRDVFIVQTLCSPVNTRIMELLILIDAFRRASAGRITAVIPYFAYGRSDKKDQPRVPITARLLANLIETAGADRILTVDLHAGQLQGFFNVPVDELTALPMLADYFERQDDLARVTILASDVGSAKRARIVSRRLGVPLAIVDKERLGNQERVVAQNLIGDVKGRRVVLIDDEIDTGGTAVMAIETALEHGAASVALGCVHAIMAEDAVQRICRTPVDGVVITDTIPLPDAKRHPKIEVLSLAPLLAEAISRISSGRSVGELFQ
ncbi:MAG TPA: ribose-phosphate pyrophosphokinase [Chloroflexota bacterium]|nr:ribose-phosphate pyrophosphokinase [Chloroflexota bacterium]